MSKFNRIGIKITAGLLIFLIILAVATIWLVARGFNQAELVAVQHSADSLQSLSQANLIQLTRLEAQLFDAELQTAAQVTQIAADNMVEFHKTGQSTDWARSALPVIWNATQLTLSPDGLLYYDANPARRTEILHPGNILPDASTDRNLHDSAVLDELFPSLLAQVKTGVGIYYQGPQLTFRYYPVRNLPEIEIENGAAEAAQTMHIEDFSVAPGHNPERKTIWLPPYVDDAGQGLLVSANTPIYYENDFQGYIGIDVSLTRLIDRVNKLQPTNGSFAFLMDGEGRLIAAPPQGAALLIDPSIAPQQTSPAGLLGLPLTQKDPVLAAVLTAVKQRETGAIQDLMGDEMRLVTYAPLPEMGWSLSVVVPIKEVTAESQTVMEAIRRDAIGTVRSTLLIMAVFFLIATLASIFLSHRFLNRPLRELLGGVRAISAGNLDVSVPVSSADELGELASSFNQMAGELNHRTQELTQTSAELQVKKAQLKVAALEERQRLARELHDSVSQALYGIALGARTAQTQLERDPSKVAEPIDYILTLADAGLSEMRALIFELRPESLQNEGLVAALTKQSDALRARYKLDVQTDLCPDPDIPIEQKEMFYRIAQEAMHNVAKHARATRVDLSLREEGSELILEVRDNGKGFDATAEYPGHLGLHSMRERVADQGGKLSIESQPGGGTVIQVCLPK